MRLIGWLSRGPTILALANHLRKPIRKMIAVGELWGKLVVSSCMLFIPVNEEKMNVYGTYSFWLPPTRRFPLSSSSCREIKEAYMKLSGWFSNIQTSSASCSSNHNAIQLGCDNQQRTSFLLLLLFSAYPWKFGIFLLISANLANHRMSGDPKCWMWVMGSAQHTRIWGRLIWIWAGCTGA